MGRKPTKTFKVEPLLRSRLSGVKARRKEANLQKYPTFPKILDNDNLSGHAPLRVYVHVDKHGCACNMRLGAVAWKGLIGKEKEARGIDT